MNIIMKHIFSKTVLCVLFTFLFTNTALAHKVTVFAWVEGNTVYGESKFSGGRKAQGAEVIVSDLEGTRLLTVQTDEKGDFSFPIPKQTGLKIELIAGMGHKGEWTLTAEEVGASAPNQAPENAEGKAAEQTGSPVAETGQSNSEATRSAVQSENPGTQDANAEIPDKAELRAMIEKSVEKSLDEKLKPVIRMLADSRQKGPTVNEIAGGIGYIFGLMGLVLYFKSRKEKG